MSASSVDDFETLPLVFLRKLGARHNFAKWLRSHGIALYEEYKAIRGIVDVSYAPPAFPVGSDHHMPLWLYLYAAMNDPAPPTPPDDHYGDPMTLLDEIIAAGEAAVSDEVTHLNETVVRLAREVVDLRAALHTAGLTLASVASEIHQAKLNLPSASQGRVALQCTVAARNIRATVKRMGKKTDDEG